MKANSLKEFCSPCIVNCGIINFSDVFFYNNFPCQKWELLYVYNERTVAHQSYVSLTCNCKKGKIHKSIYFLNEFTH